MKKFLIIVALVLVVAAGAGAFYLYQQDEKEKDTEVQAEAERVAGEIADTVKTALSYNTPVSWVFDANDNLITAIRASRENIVARTIPSAMFDTFKQRCSGDPTNYLIRKYVIANSLGGLSDSFYTYATNSLSKLITEEEEVQYLASTCPFGKSVGLVNACIDYFNTDVTRVTPTQLNFLSYAFDNESATPLQFVRDNSLVASEVGFVDAGDYVFTIGAIVQNEATSISGIDFNTESYQIRLSIATSEQLSMQNSVDTAMRKYIELASDGSFTIDASVCVMDNRTGLIKVMIPARTSSATSKMFQMNTSTWSDNFWNMITKVSSPGVTRYTLLEHELFNGDIELKSMSEYWHEQMFATGMAQESTAMDILNDVKVLVLTSKPVLVSSVITSSGEKVFDAEAPVAQPDTSLSIQKLRNMFVGDNIDEATVLADCVKLDTGVVYFEVSKEYTTVVLLGTSMLSKTLTDSTVDSLAETAETIARDASVNYPTPTKKLYQRTETMAEQLTNSYSANYDLLAEQLEGDFEHLRTMTINSVETRRQFETEYDRVRNELNRFQVNLEASRFVELGDALYAIRQERADVLLQYSV